MTSNDWTHLDASVSATAPHPDLFGGDLFGDELIDIYNSDPMDGANGGLPTGKLL